MKQANMEGSNLIQPRRTPRWMNRTVLGIGLASLFSDWSHEIATTLMPAFLASMGVAALWLGLIEGFADGLSSFAKMASGFYTDRLKKRKSIAVWGYLVTAAGTGVIGFASAAWHGLRHTGHGQWCGRFRFQHCCRPLMDFIWHRYRIWIQHRFVCGGQRVNLSAAILPKATEGSG
jgi:hypothetical protein